MRFASYTRYVLVTAALFGLLGCSVESKYSEPLQKLRDSMKDPNSVEFRNVRESIYQGDPYVCGEVNAKNGFGAYGGYKRFVSDKYGYDIHLDDSNDPLFDPKWNTFCGNN